MTLCCYLVCQFVNHTAFSQPARQPTANAHHIQPAQGSDMTSSWERSLCFHLIVFSMIRLTHMVLFKIYHHLRLHLLVRQHIYLPVMRHDVITTDGVSHLLVFIVNYQHMVLFKIIIISALHHMILCSSQEVFKEDKSTYIIFSLTGFTMILLKQI